MHIFNSICAGLSGMMNGSSNLFLLSIGGFINKIKNPLELLNSIINLLISLIYNIFKWLLLVVDIIFSYVQQLAGLGTNFNSLESIFSGESDLVFNLFYSSKNVVIPIIKVLVILGIVFIIIFSIFAIIRSSLKSLNSGGKNQTAEVIKKMFKAFLLMILTPLIAVGGIVASNAILQSLYAATNVSGAISLGSQVFAASSTSANSFRIYAKNGKRIPIVFDFSRDDEMLEYYSDKTPTSEYLNYLTGSQNIIYATYMMFSNNGYIDYDVFTDSLTNLEGNEDAGQYYTTYDTSSNRSLSLFKYRRIQSYREEYFAMADLIDYCVRTNSVVYYKTIEEVLRSVASIYETDNTGIQYTKNDVFNNIVSYFGIEFYDRNENLIKPGTITAENFIYDNTWQIIRYHSDYFTGESDENLSKRVTIEYNHLRGQTDERLGAKYIIATERSMAGKNSNFSYFYPLTNHGSENSSTSFKTSYIADGQIMSAKGLFDEGKYPTAIRQKANGDVQFYRDKIDDCMVGVIGELAGIRSRFNGSVLNKIFTFIKSLFNPSLLLPEVVINENAVALTYHKNEETVCALSSGKLHISYMFNDILNFVGINHYELKLSTVFQIRKINFLVLIAGTIILISISFKAMLRLINRAFELFLTILVYPAACATIPIDDNGYKEWLNTYRARLFGAYGIILGINFVLMLFPVIESIKFFDTESVATSSILQKITSLFFGQMSFSGMANILNFVTAIMFELVALTILSDKGILDLVATFAGGKNDAEVNPFKNAVETIMTPIRATNKVVSGAAKSVMKVATKKGRQEIGNAIRGSLPGSAVAREFLNAKDRRKKKLDQKDAKMELQKALGSDSSSAKDVEAAMKKYIDSMQKRTAAIKDPLKERQNTEKEEEKEANRKFKEELAAGGPSQESKAKSRAEDENNDNDSGEGTTKKSRRRKRTGTSFDRAVEKKLNKKRKKRAKKDRKKERRKAKWDIRLAPFRARRNARRERRNARRERRREKRAAKKADN